MVVSSLIGGLGNQMFQYAAGRALSLSRGLPLFLDVSEFEFYDKHQGYELARIFDIAGTESDTRLVRDILGWRSPRIVRRVLKRSIFSKMRGDRLAVEPSFNYWPELQHMGSPIYMMGYWQSSDYFESFSDQIREDFRFRLSLDRKNLEMIEQIRNCEAISLHVRRGDYVSHRKTRSIMSECTIDYYRLAVSAINRRVSDPTFFVFSDDLDWACENLRFLKNSVFVNINTGSRSFRDMQLMSNCKHNIIANSSFSWWGAWLNSNPRKLVFAPKSWFCDGTSDRTLIPLQWTRL